MGMPAPLLAGTPPVTPLHPVAPPEDDDADTPALKKQKLCSTGGAGLKADEGSTQQWTVQEDNQLRRLVEEHGLKWLLIASEMDGRQAKQCHGRWVNQLIPGILTGEWTEEEERTLVDGHKRLGNVSLFRFPYGRLY